MISFGQLHDRAGAVGDIRRPIDGQLHDLLRIVEHRQHFLLRRHDAGEAGRQLHRRWHGYPPISDRRDIKSSCGGTTFAFWSSDPCPSHKTTFFQRTAADTPFTFANMRSSSSRLSANFSRTASLPPSRSSSSPLPNTAPVSSPH